MSTLLTSKFLSLQEEDSDGSEKKQVKLGGSHLRSHSDLSDHFIAEKHVRENNSKDMLMPLYNYVQASIPNCFPHTCLLTVPKARAGASLPPAGGTRLLELG